MHGHAWRVLSRIYVVIFPYSNPLGQKSNELLVPLTSEPKLVLIKKKDDSKSFF